MKNASLLTLIILTLTGVLAGAQPNQAVSKRDIPNFGQVAPNIYRGAAPTAAGLKKLKEMGVKTIIDLRIEKKGQPEETSVAKQLGLNRIRIPMGSEAPTTKQVATFMQAIENAGNSPVFVHCQHGADRTGAMIGIYRVTKQSWTFDQTYKEMRKYGFKSFLLALKGSVKSRATK
jgi:tyrosine-protein phosphatase SIW14